ncbi:thrombospondin type 3 repeat-containing protein [Pontiella desulfatans]|nr:thrombospondin type 3 repeat-containing protein [Pontiella desulfatans]
MKVLMSCLLLCSTSFAVTRYVDLDSTNPTPPYSSWATAATDIQTAIDAGSSYDLILVADGTYFINEAIDVKSYQIVQSENGADSVTVDPLWYDRAFELDAGSVLDGFTIVDGYSASYGGGVLGYDGSIVKNCIIADCASELNGGGIYRGIVTNCIVEWNWSYERGGGVADADVVDCVVRNNDARNGGGGIYDCSVESCLVYSNYADANGGGLRAGNVKNSLIYGNFAKGQGGGVSGTTARNITVCDNRSSSYGGGAFSCTLYNSIVYHNDSSNVHYDDMYSNTKVMFTCSSGVTDGLYGCTTNAPMFVNRTNANYRLLESSPCIDSGINAHVYTAVDLDGNPRVLNVVVDMGAYEFQSADSNADPDGDGLTNAEEARYGTNPLLADTDGDGFDDFAEVHNGLNATSPDDWIATYIANNPDQFGLGSSGVVDVAVGQLLLGVSNGYANLSLQLEQSSDLTSWTNAGDSVEWSMTVETNAQFFRVRAEP